MKIINKLNESTIDIIVKQLFQVIEDGTYNTKTHKLRDGLVARYDDFFDSGKGNQTYSFQIFDKQNNFIGSVTVKVKINYKLVSYKEE
jgi:hypothetical protein